MMMYKIGDRGPKVARLQSMLNQQPTTKPKLSEDGVFGPRTEDAVQCFQALQQERPSGVVMDGTWNRLKHRSRATESLGEAFWLRIARLERGIAQASRADNPLNARVQAYHRLTRLRSRQEDTPWDSSFVNWVLHKANIVGTQSAASEDWLQWGRKLAQPVRGAIVVLHRKGAIGPGGIMGAQAGYHVGFLLQKTATKVRVLMGDQHSHIGETSFDLSEYEVAGYRWPPSRSRQPLQLH